MGSALYFEVKHHVAQIGKGLCWLHNYQGTGWEQGSLAPLLILLPSLSSLANNKTYNLLIAIQTQQRVYMICSDNQMVLNKILIKQRQMAFNKGSYKPVWEP